MAKVISDLSVRIGANTVGLSQGLKRSKQELSGFAQLGKMVGPQLAAAFSVGAVVAFGVKAVEAYDKSIQAEKGLLNALNGREDVQQRLLAQASDIQGRTTFEDDDIVSQQKYLASLKLNEMQIKKVIEASIQLSIATGQDLDTSVKQLSQTYGGASKGLGKMIPQVKAMTAEQLKNGEAVDYVLKNFKGYAEVAAREGLGPMKQLGNTLGNLSEAFGGKLTPLVGAFATKMNELATGIMPRQSDAIREQQRELNSLVIAATDARISTEGRARAIQEITVKYPTYLKGLDVEKVTNEQLLARLKDVNSEYDRKIAYMVKEESLTETRNKAVRLGIQEVDAVKRITDAERDLAAIKAGNSKLEGVAKINRIFDLNYQKSQNEDLLKQIALRKEKIRKEEQEILAAYSKIYGTDIPEFFKDTTDAQDGSVEEVYKYVGSLADLNKQLSELESKKQNLPWAEKNVETIANLNGKIEVLKKKIDELNNASNKVHPIEQIPEMLKPRGLGVSGVSADPLPESMVSSYETKLQRMVDVSEEAAYMIHGLFTDMAVGIGESLGNLLSGETGLESLFSNVLGSFGKFAKQFGELLIAQAIAVQALRKVFINPVVALAAGIALVAIGTAMQNVQREAAPKLAGGGLAYGPTYAMVGDNRNASVDPEVIAPLSKLKSIMGGAEPLRVEFIGKIQGRDIVFTQVKEERRRRLTN